MPSTIEVLAPIYPDVVRGQSVFPAVFPVDFQVEAVEGPTKHKVLVTFPRGQDKPKKKSYTCVNPEAHLKSTRCYGRRLLVDLIKLQDASVFTFRATYVVMDTTRQHNTTQLGSSKYTEKLALFRLQLDLDPSVNDRDTRSLHSNVSSHHVLLSHLQYAIGGEEHRQVAIKKNRLLELRQEGIHNPCHVVGCHVHHTDAVSKSDHPLLKTGKLRLAEVFLSLEKANESSQMAIREDRNYPVRNDSGQKILTDLPVVALHNILRMLQPRQLAAMSAVCSTFQHISYEVVPGLKLVLFPHQQRALKWLMQRESPSLDRLQSLPHPYVYPSDNHQSGWHKSIDLVDKRLSDHPTPAAKEFRGGLFCDEPGLGKTITMLALILRTKGLKAKTSNMERSHDIDHTHTRMLRNSSNRGREVNLDHLHQCKSTLIIVPDPLLDHWEYQMNEHILPSSLTMFFDHGGEIPEPDKLVDYDVVVTVFSRLNKEWKFRRPSSALEMNAPERYGFEGAKRYINGEVSSGTSPLLMLHWARVIVDEGHKLGGTHPNDQMRMARLLYAERRWVMTGTPTPNTLVSQDLTHMHGLLVFLRDRPYGDTDGKAWRKAIANPFEENEPDAFHRVQQVLDRVMLRHTKESIRHLLPSVVRRIVLIDPTPTEHKHYNTIAGVVRLNLVLANMDPKKPGIKHPDSLLNPINRTHAIQVLRNLRFACCGGYTLVAYFKNSSSFEEAVRDFYKYGMEEPSIIKMRRYMTHVLGDNETPCEKCGRDFKLLLVFICGHLVCPDCTWDHFTQSGSACCVCLEPFDPEVVQKIQPGFEYQVKAETSGSGTQPQQQPQLPPQGQQAGNNRPATGQVQPRRQLDFTRDIDYIQASKPFYAIQRVRELKKEFKNRRGHAGERTYFTQHDRSDRPLKIILYSDMKDHIWHAYVAFKQHDIKVAPYMTGIRPAKRAKALEEFRHDDDMNVLLLTEYGSHGLDLSFVTHILLLDEIWDKSLEQQVISRAHRMGANESVIVEQLVMRDSLEVLMHDMSRHERLEDFLPSDQLQEQVASIESNASSERPRRKPRHSILSEYKSSSHMRKQSTPRGLDDVQSKRTKLHQQVLFLLNNLRLLDASVAAEARQVRFQMQDEERNVLREATHLMPEIQGSTERNDEGDQGLDLQLQANTALNAQSRSVLPPTRPREGENGKEKRRLQFAASPPSKKGKTNQGLTIRREVPQATKEQVISSVKQEQFVDLVKHGVKQEVSGISHTVESNDERQRGARGKTKRKIRIREDELSDSDASTE